MDVAYQNTRGALLATANRLAKFDVVLQFVSDEYDELQDDGTYTTDAAYTESFKGSFSGGLLPEQIQRLASAGLTVQNGATLTIPQELTLYAERAYVNGFWWRVVEQATAEGITNFTLDKIAAESVGEYG